MSETYSEAHTIIEHHNIKFLYNIWSWKSENDKEQHASMLHQVITLALALQ